MEVATRRFRDFVGVVGAGRAGIALAHRIAASGHQVYLLTSIPQRAAQLEKNRTLKSIVPELDELHRRVQVTTDPLDIANHCTLILLTVSDAYFRRLLDPLGRCLDGAHRIVHAVHNLYSRRLQRTSDKIRELTSVKQLGVLAGPLHMSELLGGVPNAAVIASEFPSLIRDFQSILSDGNLMIQEQEDMYGVELAAALHQVVNLTIGISNGLGLGSATHSTLATVGMAEIAALGERLGANPRTFFGIAGLGRMIDALTSGEPNYALGTVIGESDNISQALAEAPPEAKSVEIVRQVNAWTKDNGISLPMMGALTNILNGAQIELVFRKLMRDRGLFRMAEAWPGK